VWIVGGVVVAIGAIAYLSYNKAPAGKDAAGTIVEAKRARADGTNSFNPAPTASTTEQNASDASKAMAGPDAAKDAATAAAGGGDAAMRHAESMQGGTKSTARPQDSADAAAAAGGGSSQALGRPKAANAASGISQQQANTDSASRK
jgi:hypothetical protein